MSTFSTKGGLYEKAARRFGLADGMRLFSYAFFDKQRLESLVRNQRLDSRCCCQLRLLMCGKRSKRLISHAFFDMQQLEALVRDKNPSGSRV